MARSGPALLYIYIYMGNYRILNARRRIRVAEIVQKISALYDTRKLLAVFTRRMNLSWARWIQSIACHPNSLRYIFNISLSLRLYLGLPSSRFPAIQPQFFAPQLNSQKKIVQTYYSIIVALGGLSCLPLYTRFAGWNPAEDDGFLWAIKIGSTTFFGGEEKPAVPCRKIIRHVKDNHSMKDRGKIQDISHKLSPASLLGVIDYWNRALVDKWGMIRTQTGKHNRSIMVAVHVTHCAIPPHNINNTVLFVTM
jgi:hypothetical protein